MATNQITQTVMICGDCGEMFTPVDSNQTVCGTCAEVGPPR